MEDEQNVSFLSLLMAPDNSPEDLSLNFNNILQTPPYYYNNNYSYHQTNQPIPDYNNYTNNTNNNNNNSNVTSYLYNPLEPEYYFDFNLPCEFSTYVDNLIPEHSNPNPNPNPQASLVKDDYSLDCILENYLKYSKSSKKKNRKKRSKLGEKVYNLGRVLPGVQMKRKNTVEVLEEAHKYVKFLEAQVMALQSMPTHSFEFAGGAGVGVGNGGGGALMKLNRQQVLEVVVNSAAAQMVMAENGWCLVSAEQVALMKRVEARNNIIQQVLNTIPF